MGAPQSMMGEIEAIGSPWTGSASRQEQGKPKKCRVSSWGCVNILEWAEVVVVGRYICAVPWTLHF